MKTLVLDYYNNEVKLPLIGSKVLRDGYVFTVSQIEIINDVFIIASISLRGDSGELEIGYYDYLKHEKVD